MENLLRNDYTAHYLQPASAVANIYQETNEHEFELEDDNNRETQIFVAPNSGTAVYTNPNGFLIGVINYDKFVTSLPHQFQRGRKRCDLIVYTTDSSSYFLLNELKDTNPLYDVQKSTPQLEQSLTDLMNVPSINIFINTFTTRKCCFFNKRASAPLLLSATSAFNQVNTIALNGFRLPNAIIEALGFTFHKYYGGHKFVFN